MRLLSFKHIFSLQALVDLGVEMLARGDAVAPAVTAVRQVYVCRSRRDTIEFAFA